MRGFETFVVVDWSARSAPSPARPVADAIWIAVQKGTDTACTYHRTRSAASAALHDLFEAERAAGRRVLAGFDFPFAYPQGFARAVTGRDDPFAVWEWLADAVQDAEDNANNRWDVARRLNGMFPGTGPFWGCPAGEAGSALPARGTRRTGHGMPERRRVEREIRAAHPVWKLYTTGSVGSQALLGLPRLQAMRRHFGPALSVAPFEPPETEIVLVEVFPSLIAAAISTAQGPDEIKDRAQVRVVAEVLSRLPPERLDTLLRAGDPVEGWIFGAGQADVLAALATAPPVRNIGGALPTGVDWMPVDKALGILMAETPMRAGAESAPLVAAVGRILAQDVRAARANPPAANTAVDGYGILAGRGPGVHRVPLAPGRAAAGVETGPVPDGQALRVLTGACLPEGVDTVILEEEVTVADGHVLFRGPLRTGANTRAAGEDVSAGDTLFQSGHVVRPGDLALAAATGHATLPVRKRLRVGVLSTGEELAEAGQPAGPGRIYDANRPMLLGQIAGWGMTAVDLGQIGDDRADLRAALDRAEVEAIVTTGGASAGEEDHVSALLDEAGALKLWRVAVKPGRPFAFGIWGEVPVFALPGNPVAAFVCALVFACPALLQMAGAGWTRPMPWHLPARFSKSKKAGRREYLRARRTADGGVEVFGSEGSGRISGLSWAEGLVELPDAAVEIRPGDSVAFFPFSAF